MPVPERQLELALALGLVLGARSASSIRPNPGIAE